MVFGCFFVFFSLDLCGCGVVWGGVCFSFSGFGMGLETWVLRWFYSALGLRGLRLPEKMKKMIPCRRPFYSPKITPHSARRPNKSHGTCRESPAPLEQPGGLVAWFRSVTVLVLVCWENALKVSDWHVQGLDLTSGKWKFKIKQAMENLDVLQLSKQSSSNPLLCPWPSGIRIQSQQSPNCSTFLWPPIICVKGCTITRINSSNKAPG